MLPMTVLPCVVISVRFHQPHKTKSNQYLKIHEKYSGFKNTLDVTEVTLFPQYLKIIMFPGILSSNCNAICVYDRWCSGFNEHH